MQCTVYFKRIYGTDNEAYDYVEERIESKNAYMATMKKQDDDNGYQEYEEDSGQASSAPDKEAEGLYGNQKISLECHIRDKTIHRTASKLHLKDDVYANQMSPLEFANCVNLQSNDRIYINQLNLDNCLIYENFNNKENDTDIPNANTVYAVRSNSINLNSVNEMTVVNATTVNVEQVETIIITTHIHFPNVKGQKPVERDKKTISW